MISRWRPTSANTSCRSMTMRRRRTSSAPAIHKDKEEVSDVVRARCMRHARKTEIDGADASRRAACCAATILIGRHGCHRRQLLRRRDRVGSAGDQRRQRDACARPAAQGPRRDLTGIEKIVPTLEDVATLMRLLPRSATGQSISNYVAILTGPSGRGRVPRRRAHVLHPGRRGPHRRARQRVPGDAAVHPLRRVHEPLPGLSERSVAMPMAGSIRGRSARS